MLAALLLAVATQAADSAAPATCKLAMLTLVAQGLPEGEAHLGPLLTDALASEIAATTKCDVVTENDMKDMLDFEAVKQQCGLDSDSCMAEIGGALGVDRVVGGSVGKIGASYVVAARVMNLRKGVVEARADEVVGASAEELRRGAQAVGRKLFGAAPPPPPAAASSSPLASPLLWVGVGVGTLGLAAAGAAGAFAVLQDGVLGRGSATTAEKDDALFVGRVLLAGAAIGAIVAVVGAGVAALAFLPGEP